MLRVTNTLRAAETGKLALHVRILERDRARARELAADSNGKAAETGPLAASLLEVASGRTAGLLDSANSADLDRVVHFLTEQKVLSPVHDQTVTTESGRPVTLIARGVRSAPSSGLAGVMTGSAAPCPQDLVVTCLPAVADRERIRLRVVRELAVAGRGAVAASASRLGVPGAGTATVMREGQTLAIAGLEEDAAQPWLPRALPFLSQVLKGRTQTSRSKDFIVLVTPQVAPPSAETETAEAASPGIRAGR
jgi:pilus assembly protein CpaC